VLAQLELVLASRNRLAALGREIGTAADG
jgi:hypothetical protein